MLEVASRLGGYEIYLLGLAGLWAAFGVGRRLRERRNAHVLHRAREGGDDVPVSLHPVIDPARCVGCGACTHACPEGRIIGLIDGKAELLDPGSCIGHGACKTACPSGAIELVFGTARRGVEIPILTSDFETSVPGVYVAGELGGMGLIANAIEQGCQAIDAIARAGRSRPDEGFDVVIVGAGPAGIAASLAAKSRGLRAITLEQDTLGGTVARYPRGKIVMTRPARLPLYGKVRLRRARKERLLGLWQSVLRKSDVRIRHGVRVERIVASPDGFDVATSAGSLRASAVLLAIGRRGMPRRLGVPGEPLPNVAYNLDDPARYRGQQVLVVGGGDSAIEAALAIARQPGARVTLSYRGSAFERARPSNRALIEAAIANGHIGFRPGSYVRAIEPHRVMIEEPAGRVVLSNQRVLICIGGEMPTAFLTGIGIRVEVRHGTA